MSVAKVVRAIDPISALRGIVEGYFAYATTVEREATKREEIWASRDTSLAEIDAQRRILMEYLQLTFAERAAAFEALFTVVDQGLAAKDPSMVVAGVKGIVDLAQISPFGALADLEQTRALLKRKDVVWEI